MTVCLLLAAGSSSRMKNVGRYQSYDQQDQAGETGLTFGAGQTPIPKMLLPFHGKTLLQHAIDESKLVNETKLLVVTGCYHLLLKEILATQQIDFVQNEDWEKGMGASIQKGITHIMEQYPTANNVIILVCDQPYISAGLLQQIITTKQQTGKGIIAAFYNNTAGTPVLFDKKYFEQLALLDGPYGAKKIVQEFAADTATVAFPLGSIDIDTAEDYEQLNKA